MRAGYWTKVVFIVWTVTLANPGLGAEAVAVPEQPPWEIHQDTVLDPARTYGQIVIRASHITIDGRGARIVGATAGNPREFQGVAISAKGVSGVTLKNVRVQGWETGLKIADGRQWSIEDCDFSDNFHDP